MKKKDNPQLETISFETISKVVDNCTTPKKSFITSDGVKIYGYDNADDFNKALKTALGMSFISMISMEITMNLTDYFLTGGAILTWWVVPLMLIVGFLTPWPYNYWRLKKYGISCH